MMKISWPSFTNTLLFFNYFSYIWYSSLFRPLFYQFRKNMSRSPLFKTSKLFKKYFYPGIFSSVFLLLNTLLFGQASFQANGDAANLGGDCYRITQAINSASGSIWSFAKIDLTQPFDFSAKLYFGSNKVGHGTGAITGGCGADGIVFVLQQVSTTVGGLGFGIGYEGITPSLGVEFDTYMNGWDPSYDHVAILKNGKVEHNLPNTIAGPKQLNASTNVKDSLDHWTRFIWDPSTYVLNVEFDCQPIISCTLNLVDSIFGGNPNVYWGFTAATGGCNNFHRVCFQNFPGEVASSNTPIYCGDTTLLFAVGAAGLNYTWTGPNGYTSNQQNPVIPNTQPANAGLYRVSASTPGGCVLFSGETTTSIILLDPVDTIPNVFTPNGDGVNDSLTITGSSKDFNVKIFNRWGQMVYDKADNDKPWDGKRNGEYVSPGVYYYIIKFTTCDDITSERKGFVTVLSKKG